MTKMKKLAAVLLAVVMAMGLAAPAWASSSEKQAKEIEPQVNGARVIIETDSGAQYSMDVHAIPSNSMQQISAGNDEFTVTYVATTEKIQLLRAGSYTYDEPEGWFDDGKNVYFKMSLTYKKSGNNVLLTHISGDCDFQQLDATVTKGFISASCSNGYAGVVQTKSDITVGSIFNEATGFNKYVPQIAQSHVCATWTATVTQRNSTCTVHYIAFVPGCSAPTTSWNQ